MYDAFGSRAIEVMQLTNHSPRPDVNNLTFTTFLFRLSAHSAAGTPTTPTANINSIVYVVGYESAG